MLAETILDSAMQLYMYTKHILRGYGAISMLEG